MWAESATYGLKKSPLLAVLFTFPSRYWSAIGLPGVFSLAGWSRLIRTGFPVPRPTQGPARSLAAFAYGALTRYGRPFQAVPPRRSQPPGGPTTPPRPKPLRFGLFPFRSPLLGESLLFSPPLPCSRGFATDQREFGKANPCGNINISPAIAGADL